MEVSLVTRDPVTVTVTDPTQVGEARRLAVGIAEALAFNDTRRGEVAIAVTELGTNLLRHAGGGELVVRSLPAAAGGGMEVLALDRGPGIANVAAAMSDGYSTGTTPGTGLGAVRRLAAEFDLFTTGDGTAVLARFGTTATPLRLGVVCLPKPGENACGDAVDVVDLGDGRSTILVVDGLGHGVRAAEAAHRAVQLFRANAAAADGPRLIDILHAGLRATRGAAVSIIDLRRRDSELRYTGVGNVGGRILLDGKSRGLLNHNGTVGAERHRVQEFAYPFPAGALLAVHSDGLASQWQLEKYAGLARRHPAVIAGVLYRDFRRDRDDVTVLTLAGSAP